MEKRCERYFEYLSTGTSPFASVVEEYGGWKVTHGDGYRISEDPDGEVRLVKEKDVGTWLEQRVWLGSGDEEINVELVEAIDFQQGKIE